MEELIFKTSNEIQLHNIIKGIYIQGYEVLNYTVDKQRNKTTFNVRKSTKDKIEKNNINEKTENTIRRIQG